MFTGLAESIEYILTPAVIVFFIGSYMSAIFETPEAYQPVWWAASYLVFLALNLWGVELSFRVSVIVTLGALAILAIYWVSALPAIDFNHWALNIAVGADGKAVELPEGGGSWFPFGWKGILATLPFAVWLFLAIEQLPLAAEESADPKKDMPKGLILGMMTLMVSALLITFLNSSVGSMEEGKMHGSFSLATSGEPLLDGFRVLYGSGPRRRWRSSRHRTHRELPHHHLCLRPADLFAGARRLLPAVHVADQREEGAAHGAVRRHVLGFLTMMIVWFVAPADKRGASSAARCSTWRCSAR
jgi:hypothetical protein